MVPGHSSWIIKPPNCLQPIEVIKATRHFMASHLKRIVDFDWSRYGYTFGDGKAFTLEQALQHFIGHVAF